MAEKSSASLGCDGVCPGSGNLASEATVSVFGQRLYFRLSAPIIRAYAPGPTDRLSVNPDFKLVVGVPHQWEGVAFRIIRKVIGKKWPTGLAAANAA